MRHISKPKNKNFAVFQSLDVVVALVFLFLKTKYIFCKYRKLLVDPVSNLVSLLVPVH